MADDVVVGSASSNVGGEAVKVPWEPDDGIVMKP
jgi:hypothetical protein